MNVPTRRHPDAVSIDDALLSSLSPRFAALEKLRRAIFSPVRRSAVALAVALALAASSTASAKDFDPKNDTTIGAGETLTVKNDEGDLKSGDNDADKKITLDGGTFVVDSEIYTKLGDGSGVKNWAWGQNGGTIDVADRDLFLYKAIAEATGDLTKSGDGKLVVENGDGETSYLDNLSIDGGALWISGKINVGSASTKDERSKLVLSSEPLVATVGDYVVEDDKWTHNEGSPSDGGLQIDAGKYVDIYGADVDSTLSAAIETVGTSFNSEGTLTLAEGAATVSVRNFDDALEEEKKFNELRLNLAALNVVSKGKDAETGDVDQKRLTLIADEYSSINLKGATSLDGGFAESEIGEAGDYASLTTDGLTNISGAFVAQNGALAEFNGATNVSGKFTNANGANATFNGAVTVTGTYKSTPSGNAWLASDRFNDNLTIAKKGDFSSQKFALAAGKKLSVTDDANALLYGEENYAENAFEGSGDERASISLSKNGALTGGVENVDATTEFVDGGKLVLGNVNEIKTAVDYTQYDNEFGTNLKALALRAVMEDILGKNGENRDKYVHDSKISGDGTIEIASAVGYAKGVGDRTSYVALMSGDKTGFTGDTNVKLGSLGLYCEPGVESSFQYGCSEKKGTFTVSGETYGADGTLLTNGQLVFWRPDSNVAKKDGEYVEDEDGKLVVSATLNDAPILYADAVNIGVKFEEIEKENEKGEKVKEVVKVVEDNALLFFNTYFEETTKDESGKITTVANGVDSRKIGTISANSIDLDSSNFVWYDGISRLAPTATSTITLDAPTINVDGEKIVDTSTSKQKLEEVFSKPLVDSTAQAITRDDQVVGYEIANNAKTLYEFALEHGASENELKIAAGRDEIRAHANSVDEQDALRAQYEEDELYYEAMWNEKGSAKVLQTIRNEARAGTPMINHFVHYGNPTSGFFSGAVISGAHKRAQSDDPDYKPDSNDNGETDQSKSSIAKEDASSDDLRRSVWAAYTNTSVDGKDYYEGDSPMDGYRLRRQGIVGGIKRQIDGTTSGGLFFGLSKPKITSDGVYENVYGEAAYGAYEERIKADDFQFAGHFEKVVADVWEIALYVGGGCQSTKWRRDLNLFDGGFYRFEAEGTGNTMTGTAYLSNRIDLTDRATFRPTIGVDSEHSWLFGFSETQTAFGDSEKIDPYMSWAAKAYTFDKTYYNRNTARVGARFNWDGPQGYAGLNTQAYYAVKLGGEDSPLISYRSSTVSYEDIATHVMGNESFSAGGGGFVHLNAAKTLTAVGDFNAVWYKNATTQNVTGGVTYRF